MHLICPTMKATTTVLMVLDGADGFSYGWRLEMLLAVLTRHHVISGRPCAGLSELHTRRNQSQTSLSQPGLHHAPGTTVKEVQPTRLDWHAE